MGLIATLLVDRFARTTDSALLLELSPSSSPVNHPKSLEAEASSAIGSFLFCSHVQSHLRSFYFSAVFPSNCAISTGTRQRFCMASVVS
jgi:hypothetical protein